MMTHNLGIGNGQCPSSERRRCGSAQQCERRPIQRGHRSAPNGIYQEITPLDHRLSTAGIGRLHHHRLHSRHPVERSGHHQQVPAGDGHCGAFHHRVADGERFAQHRYGIGERHQFHDGGGVEMGQTAHRS